MPARQAVVIHRHLAARAREGDGQAAARIDLAEERLRHGLAAEHAAVECAEERVRVLRRAAHRQRLGGNQHRDERNAERAQRVKQLHLPAGELQHRAVLLLAGLRDHVAHDQHNRVRVPGRFDCASNVLVLTIQHRAAAVIDARHAALCARRLHALLHRHIRAHRLVLGVGRRMGEVRPVAVLRADVIRVRSDDRDLPDRRLKRQHAVVRQQHEAPVRRVPRRSQMLRAAQAPGSAGLLRLFKQIHAQLDRQDVAHRFVQHALLHLARAHSLNHRIVELRGGHDHVVARVRGHHGGLSGRLCDVLAAHQGVHVVPVGDDEAIKAQLAAQDVLERGPVDGKRRAVNGAVGRHDAAHARVDRLFERRQEHLAQLAVGHLRVAGVARADRLAVADVVLGAGQDVLAVREIIALKAPDDRRAHLARQVRILAERLIDPAPACVTAQAQHRRERPVQAVGGYLARRHPAHGIGHVRVPGAGRGQLRREDGRMVVEPVAVNRVDAEDHRNAQPGFLDRSLLNFARFVAQHMQERARAQARPAQRLLAPHDCIGHLNHLRGLLLQRHTGKQFFHARGHRFAVHTHPPFLT